MVFRYLATLISLMIISTCVGQNTIPLSGKWKFKPDLKNIGIQEKWYNSSLNEKVNLPGSLRDQDIGQVPGLTTQWTGSIYDSSWFFDPAMEEYRNQEIKNFPFWLTPQKYYVGAAWYQKEIVIPPNWTGKTIEIMLERPHWQTSVWIDSVFLGHQNSLSTPHKFYLIGLETFAGKHTLTIRVDNAIREIDPGINSHSISDHTQGNWNGIVGSISLNAVNPYHIKQVRIKPDLEAKSVKAQIIFTDWDKSSPSELTIKIDGINHAHSVELFTSSVDSDTMNVEIFMGNNFRAWSEFSPLLYQMKLTIVNESGPVNSKTETFGMREFTIKDKRFEINGTQIFLRGTTECCVFPTTGYPPTNTDEWAAIFEKCKEFGLNHMRFHSYCPPEAAFIAADRAGIYLQVEGPSWAKYSVSLGYGKPIDQYLMDETKRIIDSYGNHPSFCMMAYGNEPSGRYVEYLENWVEHFREYDPQRVFTGASTGRSWAIIDNSDFIVRSPPRGLEWKSRQPESNFDYRDKTENQERPYVAFEMGQWCVFPNFNEIKKYTGPLKARNFELFRNELDKKHMGHQAGAFLMASGKLQASCYKQEIEATLRTPNLAGFQLLSLNDFPGQGTALVGVLDAFWDEKGYIDGPQFSSFCNRVVPLARLPKYTFENSETLTAEIEFANFSGSALTMVPNWLLKNNNGDILNSGSFGQKEIPVGNCIRAGTINLPLGAIKGPEKLTLEVHAAKYKNQWNIWVYPKGYNPKAAKEIFITDTLDKEALKILRKGGKVLLLASGKVENGKDVVQYFTPVFWNTSWFKMRPPHTTGMYIDTAHGVFDHFPTDYYSDLQWWELANKQQVMNLENFPSAFSPIVQPIDTWFLNRRLAMLFEANVLKGKLMVCSIDLSGDLDNRIVARQLKSGILNHMLSDEFNPRHNIDPEVILELFRRKERAVWNSYMQENP